MPSGDVRFDNGAREYAAYLLTPEGRLRADLAFANLVDFLPERDANRPLHALDVGCGTGATAIRLAGLGLQVTGLDSSAAMLNLAEAAAAEAGVANRLTLRQGDATELAHLIGAASFDVVLCHNVLEYVDDPVAVLRAMAGALKDESAMLSIVLRNRFGEVLKAALQAGDLAAAEANLTAKWGFESLYGGQVRLFTSADIEAMLDAASLTSIAARGIRTVADYLPRTVSRDTEYARILELERELGRRPELAEIARYLQCIARPAGERAA